MLRSLVSAFLICVCAGVVIAAGKTASETAIGKAITVLETERDKADDPLEQAKIDKAIRELESLIDDPDAEPKSDAAKSSAVKLVVKPAVLKKKFGGKSAFNAKTGELTLTYDFSQKGHLNDFETKSVKARTSQGAVLIDGSETLTHIAKFKSVTVSANMIFKSMRGCGINSTGGTKFYTGGQFPDTIYLVVEGGERAASMVPEKQRAGTVPVTLTISPTVASARFADFRLVAKTGKKETDKGDVHQLVFEGGVEGAGFSNVIIVGVPDPDWLKEFMAE